LRGGKPALVFPIGWQIAVQMGWSRGKGNRTPVLGVGFFRRSGIPQKPFHDLLFYLHRFSVGDYLPVKGSRIPK